MGIIEQKSLMGIIIVQLLLIGFLNFITLRKISILNSKYTGLKEEYNQLFEDRNNL
ncbi:hypothetical protein [Salinicoccus cyprini]|uniref:hypothetical protein n=1 Tax=Salinicoccus cyprini TaxID=2493691 RepID=UPI0016438B5E|nr:hypothetical protein [Salinicoccus cyprini]